VEPTQSRLNGKSKEAVETNAKIDKLLLAVHSAFDSLVERKQLFDAEAVKNLFQGSMDSQMTLLALLERHIKELQARFTRDLFLFACYTGTAYADVVHITKENLFTDEEGSLWLKYARRKTDYRARVKLLPEAIALIEKYKDENRNTIFPNQSREVVGMNMRGLRVMADIKEPMTYHSGRHSFASLITLEENVPIETISRMLGHSNIKTTQVYARVTPKKLFEDMDKFIEATQDLRLII